jgi:hypothetical protein
MPEATAMRFPLAHPPQISINPAVEQELELVLARANGRLARRARRVIRALWLRALVRRLVWWQPGGRIVRMLSRSAAGVPGAH